MSNVDKRVAFLQKSAIFSLLPNEQQSYLARFMRPHFLPAHKNIFMCGDAPSHLYFIVNGEVHINILLFNGAIALLNIHRGGEIFGEIAMLDRGSRTAAATTKTDSHLLALDLLHFKEIVSFNAAFGVALNQLAIDRVRNMSFIVENLARAAEPRVACLLVRLARQHGQPTAPGVKIGARVTEEDIASFAQVSRQTVSSTLAGFRRRGLISRVGRALIVVDMEGLQRVVAGDGDNHDPAMMNAERRMLKPAGEDLPF